MNKYIFGLWKYKHLIEYRRVMVVLKNFILIVKNKQKNKTNAAFDFHYFFKKDDVRTFKYVYEVTPVYTF